MRRPREPRLDRRSFLALGAGAFILSTVPWLRGARPLVRRRVPMMGTIADLAVVGEDRLGAQRAIDAALAELARVEARMSRFLTGSDIGRANRLALGREVPITAESAGVIRSALDWARRSDGAFDPALGRATELWDVVARTVPPDPSAVRDYAARSLWREIELTETPEGGSLRFHDPRVHLDLGGIAKGYGVDRAAEALRLHGFPDALVNVGGDLVALGRSPDGDRWRVGVASPLAPGEAEPGRTFPLEDAAAATSGDAIRAFEHDGRRYHHLLDPRTGAPRVTPRHAITTVAPTCIAADAAATALFGSAPAEARAAAVRWEVAIIGEGTSVEESRTS